MPIPMKNLEIQRKQNNLEAGTMVQWLRVSAATQHPLLISVVTRHIQYKCVGTYLHTHKK